MNDDTNLIDISMLQQLQDQFLLCRSFVSDVCG